MRDEIQDILAANGASIPTFGSADITHCSSRHSLHPEVELYFKECVPLSTAVMGNYRIFEAEDISMEMEAASPGMQMAGNGFVCFASSRFGDAVAVQVRTGKVFLVSHKIYFKGLIRGNLPLNAATIVATSEKSYPSILAFFREAGRE